MSKRKLSRMMGGGVEGSPVSSAWQTAGGLPIEMLTTPEIPQRDSPILENIKKTQFEAESASSSPLTITENTEAKSFPFKANNFVHSSKGPSEGKRQRVWKSLKQIVASEKSLPWKPDDITYGAIEAPPSFKPAKKYSDLSGLPTFYTDPQTKLRYATSDEFARIRVLPSDIVSGYLTLRKENLIIT